MYTCSLRRIGVMHSPDFLFPCFLVFPPANPSNFSHWILSGFPKVLFQYRSIILYGWVERQEAVEVQDEKTGKMRRHAGRLIINPRRVGGLGYSSLSVCPCVCGLGYSSLSLSVCLCVCRSVWLTWWFRHHNLYVGKLVALKLRIKIWQILPRSLCFAWAKP